MDRKPDWNVFLNMLLLCVRAAAVLRLRPHSKRQEEDQPATRRVLIALCSGLLCRKKSKLLFCAGTDCLSLSSFCTAQHTSSKHNKLWEDKCFWELSCVHEGKNPRQVN
jgi:hypothetical protein